MSFEMYSRRFHKTTSQGQQPKASGRGHRVKVRVLSFAVRWAPSPLPARAQLKPRPVKVSPEDSGVLLSCSARFYLVTCLENLRQNVQSESAYAVLFYNAWHWQIHS